jgi:hypothetical protein
MLSSPPLLLSLFHIADGECLIVSFYPVYHCAYQIDAVHWPGQPIVF